VTRKLISCGVVAVVCAVAAFTFLLSLPRDIAPCGELFGRVGDGCPSPRINVVGLDLTPQQTAVWSIAGGLVIGGLFGLSFAWATSRRSGGRAALVLVASGTGAIAGAIYGYYRQVDCMPDGDICVGSFQALLGRWYPVPVGIPLCALIGLLVGAIVGWVLGSLTDRGQPSLARTV
jgi:ABC-type branched-subunit amino acid transport system permease subunit